MGAHVHVWTLGEAAGSAVGSALRSLLPLAHSVRTFNYQRRNPRPEVISDGKRTSLIQLCDKGGPLPSQSGWGPLAATDGTGDEPCQAHLNHAKPNRRFVHPQPLRGGGRGS